MTPPHGPELERGVGNRVLDILVHPSRHMGVIVGIAYLAALAGLIVSLWSGIDGAGSGFPVVGLVLLFASFVLLFYCSLLILHPTGDAGPRRR